jgi:excisionase family DNA binding protein
VNNDKPPATQPDALRHQPGIEKRGTVDIVVYTVEEAAQVLKISRWKIFDLIRTNQLQSVKIGGLRRIPHTAIGEYITRLLEEAA